MSTHVLALQRYSSAAGVGLTVTFVLLFLMQSLVAIQPGASVEPRNRSLVDFVRVKKVEEVRAPDPERPDEALKKAEPVPPRIGDDPGDTLPITIEQTPPPQPGDSRPVAGIRMTDGPLVAIVRVQPVYPAVAEARGLEGWVLVQFDVLADGHVANAFVVDSSSRVFEKSALNAAYRFRFKPRVVDGESLATTGIQNLFRFEMSQP
jgi:periplasmic protein TonB